MPLHGYPQAPLVAAMRRPTDLSPTCCRMNLPTPVLNTTAAARCRWGRVRFHLLFGSRPTVLPYIDSRLPNVDDGGKAVRKPRPVAGAGKRMMRLSW